MKNKTYMTRTIYPTYRLIVIILMGSLLWSCTDLLEENPKSIVVENFYKTEQEIESAVNSIYSPWRTTGFPDYIAVLDAHADWGYGRGSRAQYNEFSGLNATNINRASGSWNFMYLSIRNANLVIQNTAIAEEVSEEVKSKFIAEARFLRALAYFHLVRNWGGVPIRDENNLTISDVPRSSAEEVYNLIVSDLEYAQNALPESQADIGRPTKWAAKTLLADVYINLERYDQARASVREVIESGTFSLVPVQTFEDFQLKVFGPEIVTSTEEVFSFKFARELGEGNYMLWILNHPSTGLYNFGGAYAHYSDAADPFYQEWNDGDIRKQLWDMIDFGLGETTLVSKKFIDQSAVTGNNAGNDLPVYRYSDALLLFAEADCRANGSPSEEGMEALNQVHRRAYGMNPTQPSDVDYKLSDYNDEASFVELVLQERAYEFQFEGKRWFDLKRTGTAQEKVMWNRGLTIADRHFLWPLPNGELDYNKAMDPGADQNPGY